MALICSLSFFLDFREKKKKTNTKPNQTKSHKERAFLKMSNNFFPIVREIFMRAQFRRSLIKNGSFVGKLELAGYCLVIRNIYMHFKLFKGKHWKKEIKKYQKCISSQKAFLCFLFRDIINSPVTQAARPHNWRMQEPGQIQEFSNHVLQLIVHFITASYNFFHRG